MDPCTDIVIQKNSRCNRAHLLSLVRDTNFSSGVSVVYIYSLVDEFVNYPEKIGNIIYIGEAGRSSEPTGRRFGQHISTNDNKGGDTGTIYSLSRYYWLGKRIRLRVFLMENADSRKAKETELLKAHVKEYGALPICQGTSGANYGTHALMQLVISDELLALI